MATAGLTVDNFVQKIKTMSDRQRSKLLAAELVELIMQLPESIIYPSDEKFNKLESMIEVIKTQSLQNASTIQAVQATNVNLTEENSELKKAVNKLRTEVDEMHQYSRVDNIEIVGLPPSNIDYPDERMLLETFEQLQLETPITANDISICHVVPSKRRDEKRVVVCKFVSRKSKIAVLEAKKKMRDFKYFGCDIFINEHLSSKKTPNFCCSFTEEKGTSI